MEDLKNPAIRWKRDVSPEGKLGEFAPIARISEEELDGAMESPNADKLIIVAGLSTGGEMLIFTRADFVIMSIQLDKIKPKGGVKPDFNSISVSNYGATVRFGEYEVSSYALVEQAAYVQEN